MIPAAEALSGDEGEADYDIQFSKGLISDALHSGDGELGEALRPAVHRLPAQAPRRLAGPAPPGHAKIDPSTASDRHARRRARPGRVDARRRAERQLRSLELFGMRFGLDRMRRMMTALGSPERRFDAIHVLGTNGKSSTTRMIAAILAAPRPAHRRLPLAAPGLLPRARADRRARARRRARSPRRSRARAWAAERVNRTLAEDDHVTQFELLTAAALWEMAEQEVEVAVVEAGLGGRYDATSVIDARVTVLTNVGLEHTRWLGPDAHRHRRGEARGRRARRRRSCSAPTWRRAALAVGRAASRASAARGSCTRSAPRTPLELLAPRRLPAAQLRARARAPPRPTWQRARHRRCATQARRRGRRRDAGARAPAAGRRATRRRSSTARTTPTRVAALVESLPEVARRAARSRSCSACSRTRTPRAMLARAAAAVRARVVHRAAQQPRAARPRRCSRSPASSASTRSRASRGPRGRSRRRAGLGARARRRGARDGLGVPGRRAARRSAARRSRGAADAAAGARRG